MYITWGPFIYWDYGMNEKMHVEIAAQGDYSSVS